MVYLCICHNTVLNTFSLPSHLHKTSDCYRLCSTFQHKQMKLIRWNFIYAETCAIRMKWIWNKRNENRALDDWKLFDYAAQLNAHEMTWADKQKWTMAFWFMRKTNRDSRSLTNSFRDFFFSVILRLIRSQVQMKIVHWSEFSWTSCIFSLG